MLLLPPHSRSSFAPPSSQPTAAFHHPRFALLLCEFVTIRVALGNMAHTLTSETDAATQAKAFPSSGGEMFGEYFAPGKSWNFTKSNLLDARARRILEN